MSLAVIKLGGSLMHGNALPQWLDEIVKISGNINIVIVPGGGAFVEKVREVQARYRLDETPAHQMALLGMSQYAYTLFGINPGLHIISHADDILANRNNGRPLLWLPYNLLNDFSEIPASWDYTSDSIALWLAGKIAADKLVLVKSASADVQTQGFKKLVETGRLDRGFETLVGGYSGDVVWLEKTQYDQLAGVLQNNS